MLLWGVGKNMVCVCCCMWQASGTRGTGKHMVCVLLQVVAGKRWRGGARSVEVA